MVEHLLSCGSIEAPRRGIPLAMVRDSINPQSVAAGLRARNRGANYGGGAHWQSHHHLATVVVEAGNGSEAICGGFSRETVTDWLASAAASMRS